MRVRRFVGDSVAETMGKVKRELGSEAVILQTREFREGGFLGFFGKMKVEITAAIEETPVIAQVKGYRNIAEEKKPVRDERIASAFPAEHSAVLEEELRSMRLILQKMNNHMEGFKEEKSVWPLTLLKWMNYLKERGIGDYLINRLLSQVQQTLTEEEWEDNTKVFKRLEGNVCQICSQTGPIQPGIDKPRVVALIGPTGVGKTTTIGKLAAGFSIIDKRKVALITADTYRVAAVEQLKTFGEIIGVPVEVVMTPSGLREALDLHADKELIFIDTAGRSPHHELHMSELCAFLDQAQPDFTMLVMSATTQVEDQIQIYKRFESLTSHFIFTKLDETARAGSLINLLGQTTLPTAYLTNGQSVPDDIEVATPERIAHYVLGEGLPHA
ncbi:flagellar biosynthesis protein FlhF [Desulfosporosinus sp. PR]|uniref:flagellar biosynthesis protein FlhF n=1 Tax=Candidatus Desulfosporosinus nitrosoreducens TaxID=3401928 RepID=UPI0027FDD0A2|nr:flagellar biosynthesis protein FlhF [Desulfosporosinus sp. PR]MDQ7096221.1 flagellar biosynthesis protein FlhF [Desulfosporosinus sp. PR]